MIAPGWWSDASSGDRHFPQHEAVSVPYWEWEGAKGAGEREVYLRGTTIPSSSSMLPWRSPMYTTRMAQLKGQQGGVRST